VANKPVKFAQPLSEEGNLSLKPLNRYPFGIDKFAFYISVIPCTSTPENKICSEDFYIELVLFLYYDVLTHVNINFEKDIK
jgi:hypothetical protein